MRIDYNGACRLSLEYDPAEMREFIKRWLVVWLLRDGREKNEEPIEISAAKQYTKWSVSGGTLRVDNMASGLPLRAVAEPFIEHVDREKLANVSRLLDCTIRVDAGKAMGEVLESIIDAAFRRHFEGAETETVPGIH